MATDGHRPGRGAPAGGVLAVPAAAMLLLWPALWNGYPIVFADTGTYLSQAIHRYAGWDRPVFYSLFILPLHLTLTLWPVIVAQALLTSWVLWRVWRLLEARVAGFVVIVAALSAASWLPWVVSAVIPDCFTPLLILAIGVLAWLPDRVSWREWWGCAGLASGCIATQQSSLPLALGLAGFCMVATAWQRGRPRRWAAGDMDAGLDGGRLTCVRGALPSVGAGAYRRTPERFGSFEYTEAAFGVAVARARSGARGILARRRRPGRRALGLVVPPALAVLALCGMNLAAHGRFAVSPYGNVFLLARVIGDGPGLAALRRDCPAAGWRLCAGVDAMPATSDEFLWNADSPLYRAGGPKAVSAEADAILAAALRANAVGEARAEVLNAWQQLGRFASGDGLQPWPSQVSPWMARDFPAAENAAYLAARQQRGALAVPAALATTHAVIAAGGVIACTLLLFARRLPVLAFAPWLEARALAGRLQAMSFGRRLPVVSFARRLPHGHAGLLLTVLLSLPLSAVITGTLSAPHDRYQARIMWLPPFVAAACLAGRRQSPP